MRVTLHVLMWLMTAAAAIKYGCGVLVGGDVHDVHSGVTRAWIISYYLYAFLCTHQ